MCQSPKGVYVSFSRTGAGLCIYHLFVWSNLNFLHISQWIILPTLFNFPFLSYIQVFSSEMSFISRLKRPELFPSHFCFVVIVILLVTSQSVSFLMAVISPPSCFFYVIIESLYRCLDTVFDAGNSSSSFLDT